MDLRSCFWLGDDVFFLDGCEGYEHERVYDLGGERNGLSCCEPVGGVEEQFPRLSS